jgi:hypothetical protein
VVTVASRTIGIAVVAALLATAGLATAQSFSVTLQPQDEAGELAPGESASVNMDVRLEGEDFSCAEDEELPVQLEASSGDNVAGTPDAEELIFSGTMGVHSSDSPSGPYNETQSTSVTVQAEVGASSGTYDVTVTGTFPGGDYGATGDGSCSGEFPSAEGTTNIPVSVQASDGGTGTDDGTDTGGDDGSSTGNGTDTDDGGEDGGNGIPVGHWLAPLGLAASALLVRRR